MTNPQVEDIRWASCSKVEFGYLGEVRHLVPRGALNTLCNTSASYSEIWRVNTTKPKCPACERIAEKRNLP